MRSKLVSVAVGATLAISLLGAPGASASTRIGDECLAVTGAPKYSIVQLGAAPGPLPQTVPAAGVITSWGFNAQLEGIGGIPYTTKLKTLRATGAANTFTVVGESAREPLHNGSNAFATRIPVQAGDRLGTGGGDELAATLFCISSNPADVLGVVEGDVPLGSTQTYTPVVNARLALWASVEPDADNDGFGDETQDACPQSAAFQTPCPPVTLATSKQVKKGSVVIVVTTDTAAPVTVKGVVKLGKGKKAKLNGGTKSLAPGTLGKFTLKFTKSLKAKLSELSPRQKLTLKATVTGTSVSGAVTKKVLKVKLKGQAKP